MNAVALLLAVEEVDKILDKLYRAVYAQRGAVKAEMII